jgi:hypothetical protein
LDEPFDHPTWLFEVKMMDGFRALGHVQRAAVAMP